MTAETMKNKRVQVLHKFKELPDSIFVLGRVSEETEDSITIRVQFADGTRSLVKRKNDPTLTVLADELKVKKG